MPLLTVYAPKLGARSVYGIHPGSGIAGVSDARAGYLLLDYEGNLYGAENIKTWEDRVIHAAGRHAVRYPTIARSRVPEEDFVPVGEIDTETWKVTKCDAPDAREALEAWLSE